MVAGYPDSMKPAVLLLNPTHGDQTGHFGIDNIWLFWENRERWHAQPGCPAWNPRAGMTATSGHPGHLPCRTFFPTFGRDLRMS